MIKKEDKFVVLKSGGLGNRIKSYVSHLARYNEVYVEKLQDSIIFNLKNASTEEIKNLSNTGSVWRLLVDNSELKYCNKYKTIDFLYSEIPEYFRQKYIPIFNNLKNNLDIKTKTIIKDFAKNLDFSKITGLHIRTSLASQGDTGRAGFVDYKGILNVINESEKVLLASDFSDIYHDLKNRFGDKIISFPRNQFDRNDVSLEDLNYTREAVIEMMLLSMCSRLCLTFGSTYSECCWWFGECKSKVDLPTIWSNVPEDFLNDVIHKL